MGGSEFDEDYKRLRIRDGAWEGVDIGKSGVIKADVSECLRH